MPLIAVMLSLLVAAAIYLGVSFAFYQRTAYDAYIAWYAIAVTEVGVNLALAAQWRAMSFEKTHLVERMSCLTLIIVRYVIPCRSVIFTPRNKGLLKQLGEGIIGLTKIIVKIETFDLKFTAADIGALISAVLIIVEASTPVLGKNKH